MVLVYTCTRIYQTGISYLSNWDQFDKSRIYHFEVNNCIILNTKGKYLPAYDVSALTKSVLVGVWCLSLVGPFVAHLGIFFSSDYL